MIFGQTKGTEIEKQIVENLRFRKNTTERQQKPLLINMHRKMMTKNQPINPYTFVRYADLNMSAN